MDSSNLAIIYSWLSNMEGRAREGVCVEDPLHQLILACPHIRNLLAYPHGHFCLTPDQNFSSCIVCIIIAFVRIILHFVVDLPKYNSTLSLF